MTFRTILVLLAAIGLGTVGEAQAQTGSLRGTVKDAVTDEPLIGATVFLQENGRGASTDIDGNYELLLLQSGTYTVRVSYVGYKTRTYTVTIGTGTSVLDPGLDPDFLGLEEVVVTGTGSETSVRRLGINVESVSSDNILTAPAFSLDRSLQGKVPGMQVVAGGSPGSPSQIILRGINTMGESRPMILIDGVQVDASNYSIGFTADQSSRLADIDFSDIERVEVVKGAAAATLYGAQGANGVIQIFTKSGQNGATRVRSSTGLQFDQLNINDNVRVSKLHSYQTDAEGDIVGLTFNPNTGVWNVPALPANTMHDNAYTEAIYDNLEGYFRTGISSTNNLSISGGNSGTTFLFSANHVGQDGIEEGIGYERLSLRFNGDKQIRPDLKIAVRSNFINSNRTGITESGDNIESGLNYILQLPPFIDAQERSPDGFYRPKQESGSVSTNGLFLKQISDVSSENNRFIGNFNANYTPFRFLEVDYKLGIDYYYFQFDRLQQNATRFEDESTSEVEVVTLNPEGFFSRNAYTNRVLNSMVDVFLRTNLRSDFNLPWNVDATTLFKFDWREEKYNRTTATGNNLPTLPLETIDAGSVRTASEFRQDFVTYGFLLNQKFDFQDHAGFSVGFRGDKSSAFGRGAEYSFFPRGDVFIRPSEFGFWEPLSATFNEFKLRAAYGEAGTQPGAFSRFVTLTAGVVGDKGVLNTPATQSNPALAVEKSAEFEAGADLGFTFGRSWFSSVGLEGTYWTRSNNGAIQSLETAPSTGSSAIQDNAIDLSATGFDASLSALVLYNRDINWRSTLNFSKTRTTVDRIANGEDLVLGSSAFGGGTNFLFREGEAFGAFFGLKALRSVDELMPDGTRYIAEADVDNYTTVDGVLVNRETKRIQYRNEQELIGDPTPDFQLSFRNDFNIRKNWNVSIQWDWSHGGDIMNATKYWMYGAGTHRDFERKVLIDGGERIANGDDFDGNVPQAYVNFHDTKRNNYTEFFVEDGSYIKLREVAVSYDAADLLGLRKRGYVKNFIVGVSGRNLLTFTDYSGFDPEVSQGGQDVRYRGVDLFTYPNYRTFAFNATINF